MKYRKKFSKTMTSSTIWNTYAFKLEKYTVLSLRGGNYSNYIHLFVGAEPKYYPSIVCRLYKGITPRKTFKEYSEIKNSYGIVNSGVMKLH